VAGATLEATGLRKRFGRRQVVHDVSFVVQPGEVVGLLGANGAGKTTSFNMVAGLLKSDAGSVQLGDQDLGRLPLHRRARMGLGYLPQESTVFRGLTVRQNLWAVLETRNLGAAVGRRRAEDILERYNLQHVGDTLGSDLSGGERRRLEMARALVIEPRVLLLDEPFAGVDPIATAEIRGFVREVCKSGIGVLLTDHNVRETLKIVDRAYLIDRGKILLEGAPAVIVADSVARQTYLGEDFHL
jgi:lipopolysaccharide export system ATP-binding protein